MGKNIEHLDVGQGDITIQPVEIHKRHRRIPPAFLFAMVCAILLMDAILPLRDLWFKEALLTQLGWWPVTLSLLLFPGWSLIPPVPQIPVIGLPEIGQSWGQIPLYIGSVLVVWAIYLVALRRLPKLITIRFIRNSTLLFGFLYILFPIVTSADVFSYIAYARMGVIHHLNPLTTLPTAIRTDTIYKYLSWTDQPSAYGPTWVIITSAWQWIFSSLRLDFLLPMVLALRIQGLVMHLVSTMLVWSIGGYLQQLDGNISATRRLLATLAFAWNPLLLFEACVNAHADTTLLALILLSIWFLARNAALGNIRSSPHVGRNTIDRLLVSIASDSNKSIIIAAVILALATCLKINVVLLVPALIMYAWTRGPVMGRFKRIAAASVTYLCIFLLMYAPFWQDGAILQTLSITPATNRSINSPAAFAGHLYDAIVNNLGFPLGETIGSPAERVTHSITLGIFLVIYVVLCYRIIRKPARISTLRGMIGWMAVTWLIYCAFGSPWFWPWYIVTFFGLYALIETTTSKYSQGIVLYFVRLLTLSMFIIYCLNSWGPTHSYIPGFPSFEWSYLNGLLVWGLPLIGAIILSKVRDGRLNASPQAFTRK
ncbi:MAG TPA: hypothetical protein VEH81_00995 [Ktedonobacteraceae bacterium]|nr:hypothetical protein [Ktedonobacteraceae bacterium]